MSQIKATPVTQFLADLNGGVLEQQISHALSDVAAGVKEIGKKGKLTITFDLKRIPNTGMVSVAHTLDFAVPTVTGTRREDTNGETPLHVGAGSKITAFPEKQTDFFKQDETAKA